MYLREHLEDGMTDADLIGLGREDGAHLASIFAGLFSPGQAMSVDAVDLFASWHSAQIYDCEERLRAAGLTAFEVGCWRAGCRAELMSRLDALSLVLEKRDNAKS
jgi:hypothetical protein